MAMSPQIFYIGFNGENSAVLSIFFITLEIWLLNSWNRDKLVLGYFTYALNLNDALNLNHSNIYVLTHKIYEDW